MTLNVYVDGIGMLGPGLEGWSGSRPALAGARPYAAREVALPRPACLPPMERRRASASVRLATHVAQEALAQSGLGAETLAAVFASADGDTEILDYLCTSLAEPDKIVSPTRFHNSVHNAPSGYWNIGAGSQAPANSLSCYDVSFAGGLLEAACQAVIENRPVLLSAYDIPVPRPLSGARRVEVAFGAALVLNPTENAASSGSLVVDLEGGGENETGMDDPELEKLRRANPAARALPLLASLARGGSSRLLLEYPCGKVVSVSVHA